ncbi:hypothetical protein BJX99DRAFT_227184 [Aspergillus californicus]
MSSINSTKKSWSCGRTLTEAQRHQKQSKDRINKERRRNKEQRDREELQREILALKKQVQTLCHVLGLPTTLARHCDYNLPGQEKEENQYSAHLSSLYPPPNTSPISTRTGSYILKEYSDNLLGGVHSLTPSQVCTNKPMNENALIRGIVFGWEALKQEGGGYWCPLWEIIYQIDTVIFRGMSPLTRLCMLTTMHLLLQCFMHGPGFRDIPVWYRPRPSQIAFQHDISADYFVWPGLREQLVLTGSRILTDSFFWSFASSFQFKWEYGMDDIFEIDQLTGLYSLSGVFKEALCDLRNWTMDKAFYVAFPDVYYGFTLGI